MSTERLFKHFKREDIFQVGGQVQRCKITQRFTTVQQKNPAWLKINRVKHATGFTGLKKNLKKPFPIQMKKIKFFLKTRANELLKHVKISLRSN